MPFYIKDSKLFSINEAPKRDASHRSEQSRSSPVFGDANLTKMNLQLTYM